MKSPSASKKPVMLAPVSVQDIRWGVSGVVTAFFDRNGHRYAVIIQEFAPRWQAIGIITPLPTENEETTVASVFANHSHLDLGYFDSLNQAQEASTVFLARGTRPKDPCPCTEADP